MSDAVKNLFTTISPTYDTLNHVLSFNFDKGWRRKTISEIHRQRDESFLALDLCAGTHDLGLECLRQFPNAKIIATDFSFGMLAAGQDKITQEKIAGRITPLCGDALQMPFADNTFDVVFCAYGVRNFDNTEAGIKEICRILKPNGQILVLEFFKPTSMLNKFFNRTYGEHVLPRLGHFVSGHKGAYAYLRDSIRGFLSVNDFKSLLQKLEFDKICARDFFLGISTCVSAHKTKSGDNNK